MTRLVRALSLVEACDGSCFAPGCDADPTFRVSTPDGALDFCDRHIDATVAALPQDWIQRFDAADLFAPWEKA